jgi:hypothetical protein
MILITAMRSLIKLLSTSNMINLIYANYQEDLFKHALNLQDPWHIKSIEFSNVEKRLDIHIDFEVGSRFECSVCETSNCAIHDTVCISNCAPR